MLLRSSLLDCVVFLASAKMYCITFPTSSTKSSATKIAASIGGRVRLFTKESRCFRPEFLCARTIDRLRPDLFMADESATTLKLWIIPQRSTWYIWSARSCLPDLYRKRAYSGQTRKKKFVRKVLYSTAEVSLPIVILARYSIKDDAQRKIQGSPRCASAFSSLRRLP